MLPGDCAVRAPDLKSLWCSPAGELTAKDEAMLSYMSQAVRSEDPFAREAELDPVLVEALEWQAQRTPEQIMSEREAFVAALERAGQALCMTGAREAWLGDCDVDIKQVWSHAFAVVMSPWCGLRSNRHAKK